MRPTSAMRRRLPSSHHCNLETLPATTPPPASASVQRPRVYMRLKPTDAEAIFKRVPGPRLDTLQIHHSDLEKVQQLHKNWRTTNETFSEYGWDKIFEANITQEEIFDVVGTDVMDALEKRINSTILAYGQTGSGKTYTVQGPREPSGAHIEPTSGLVPRLFHRIYERFRERSANEVTEFELRFRLVEFGIEAKLETLRDLLQREAGQPRLLARHKMNVRAGEVTNAREVRPRSFSEAVQIYFNGCKHRVTMGTQMNHESSRSQCAIPTTSAHTHRAASALLMLTVRWTEHSEVGNAVREAHINVLDLAGSEDPKKSHAKGDVLDQAIFINQTLSVLTRIVCTLAIASISSELKSAKLVEQVRLDSGNAMLTKVLMPRFLGTDMIHLVVNAHNELAQLSESVRAARLGLSCLCLKLKLRANADLENTTDMPGAIEQTNEELMQERLRRQEAEESAEAMRQENEALRMQNSAASAANELLQVRLQQTTTPSESQVMQQHLELLRCQLDSIKAQMAFQNEELKRLRTLRDEDGAGYEEREALQAALLEMEEQKRGLESIIAQAKRENVESERRREEEERKRVEAEQDLQQRLEALRAEKADLEQRVRNASEQEKDSEVQQREMEKLVAKRVREVTEELERIYESRYEDDFEADDYDDDVTSSCKGAPARATTSGARYSDSAATTVGVQTSCSNVPSKATSTSSSTEPMPQCLIKRGCGVAVGTQAGVMESPQAVPVPQMSKQTSWQPKSPDVDRAALVQNELSAVRERVKRFEEGSDEWKDAMGKSSFLCEILERISKGLTIGIELPLAQINDLHREIDSVKARAAEAHADAEDARRRLHDKERELVRILEETKWRKLRDENLVNSEMLKPATLLLRTEQQTLSSKHEAEQDDELRIIYELFPEYRANKLLKSLISVDSTVVRRFQSLGGIALLLRLIAAEIEQKKRNSHHSYGQACSMMYTLGLLMDTAGQKEFVETSPDLKAWCSCLDSSDDNIDLMCQAIARIAHGCETIRHMLHGAGIGAAIFEVLRRECQKKRGKATKEVRQDVQTSSTLALSALVERYPPFRQDLMTLDWPLLILPLLDKRNAVPSVIKNALLTVVNMTHKAPDAQNALLCSVSKCFLPIDEREANILDAFIALLFDKELDNEDALIRKHAGSALLNVVADAHQAAVLLDSHPHAAQLRYALMEAMCYTLEKRAEKLGSRVQTSMSTGGLDGKRKYFGISVKGSWDESNAGGSRNSSMFHDNPQLLLESKPGTSFVLVLTDLDYDKRSESKERREDLYLGMLIKPANEKTVLHCWAQLDVEAFGSGRTEPGLHRDRPTYVLADGRKLNTNLCTSRSNNMYCRVAEDATTLHWVVVPYCLSAGLHARFVVTVFADSNVKLTRLDAWQKHTLCSQWTSETSSPLLTEPRWRCCPQFALVNHGQQKCDALVLLRYEEVHSYEEAGLLLGRTEADDDAERQAAAYLAKLPEFQLATTQSKAAMRVLHSAGLKYGTTWTSTLKTHKYNSEAVLPMQLEGEHILLALTKTVCTSTPVGFRMVVYSAPQASADICLKALGKTQEWLSYAFCGGTDDEGSAALVVDVSAHVAKTAAQMLVWGDKIFDLRVRVREYSEDPVKTGKTDESERVISPDTSRDGVTCFKLPDLLARQKYIIDMFSNLCGTPKRITSGLHIVLCSSCVVFARPPPGCDTLQSKQPRPQWLWKDGVTAWPVSTVPKYKWSKGSKAGKSANTAVGTSSSIADEVLSMLKAMPSKEAVAVTATGVIRKLEQQRDELVSVLRTGGEERSHWMQKELPEVSEQSPLRGKVEGAPHSSAIASHFNQEQESMLVWRLQDKGITLEAKRQLEMVHDVAQLGLDFSDAFARLVQELAPSSVPSATVCHEKVRIKVVNPARGAKTYIIKRDAKLSKVQRKYCEDMELQRNAVQFKTRMGQTVQPTDTPNSLNMQDEEIELTALM